MTDDGPLIVQSDKTFLLETGHPLASEARAAVSSFGEIIAQPEHYHTYRITPLGLWNASATGVTAEQVCDALTRYSKYPVAPSLLVDITEIMSRYGRLQLVAHDDDLALVGSDPAVLAEVSTHKTIRPLLSERLSDDSFLVLAANRGLIKQALLKIKWPAEDLAGFTDGEHLPIELAEGWQLRDYQQQAVEAFTSAGSGVIMLPCGGGKTIVAMAAMAALDTTTLILVTNTASVRQWKRELVKRTSLTEDQVGEYSGAKKEIRPVTIATFQVMTIKDRNGERANLELFDAKNWGLIIYDEVHMLPAPVFGLTASIQSRRRLGLTATLVREDGREGDVFTLVGPKRFDAPWRAIEALGGIAKAECVEVRVRLTGAERSLAEAATGQATYKVAATVASKLPVVKAIMTRHPGEPTLVIGCYLDQLQEIAAELGDVPIIQGSTHQDERDDLFAKFRTGEVGVLVVSKVANFSIDLPDASLAIQISGTFGSRQEEAQRLGRLTRPKADGRTAHFYTVIAADTVDVRYAANRQRFLAEQGYAYTIIDADDLDDNELKEVA